MEFFLGGVVLAFCRQNGHISLLLVTLQPLGPLFGILKYIRMKETYLKNSKFGDLPVELFFGGVAPPVTPMQKRAFSFF